VAWSVGRSLCLSVYLTSEPSKTAEPIEMSFGLWAHSLGWAQGITNDIGVQIPHGKGHFWEWPPIVMHRDFLPWAVQKRLNRSNCRLGCGLGWAEGSTRSIVFARVRQCALIGRHSGEYDWTVRLLRQCCLMSNYFDHLYQFHPVLVFRSQLDSTWVPRDREINSELQSTATISSDLELVVRRRCSPQKNDLVVETEPSQELN